MTTFRFRRRINLMPGLTVNLGKRGASFSVGVKGAHATFGRCGSRPTVGLPGTGLSATDYEAYHRGAAPTGKPGVLVNLIAYVLFALFLVWLFWLGSWRSH